MAFKLLEPTRHDIYPFIDPSHGLKNAAAGKIVLVTGSGEGIGRAIAEAFALAGASEVILAARRQAPLEETKKIILRSAPDCKVSVFSGVDISKYVTVKKMFDALPEPPDVVVSNAAVSLATATVLESEAETWFEEIDVDVKGAYAVAQLYVRAVQASSKQGCLINVSSNASWRCIPGRSSYGMSKVAMNTLSEYVNCEESRVRCVAMHPGGVITELASGDDLPKAIRSILIDTPALPGGTAVYLSTGRARFLMGKFVPATWDMEEWERHRERIEKEGLLQTGVLGVMA